MAALATSLSQLGMEDADALEDDDLDLLKTRGWLLRVPRLQARARHKGAVKPHKLMFLRSSTFPLWQTGQPMFGAAA